MGSKYLPGGFVRTGEEKEEEGGEEEREEKEEVSGLVIEGEDAESDSEVVEEVVG